MDKALAISLFVFPEKTSTTGIKIRIEKKYKIFLGYHFSLQNLLL